MRQHKSAYTVPRVRSYEQRIDLERHGTDITNLLSFIVGHAPP